MRTGSVVIHTNDLMYECLNQQHVRQFISVFLSRMGRSVFYVSIEAVEIRREESVEATMIEVLVPYEPDVRRIRNWESIIDDLRSEIDRMFSIRGDVRSSVVTRE